MRGRTERPLAGLEEQRAGEVHHQPLGLAAHLGELAQRLDGLLDTSPLCRELRLQLLILLGALLGLEGRLLLGQRLLVLGLPLRVEGGLPLALDCCISRLARDCSARFIRSVLWAMLACASAYWAFRSAT